MGKQFGDLAFIRGILYYTLSPHEQKAFAGAFSRGLPNFVTRAMPTMWTWLPVFLIAIATYTGVEAAYKQRQRKNPDDFINEINPNPQP